MLDLSQPSKARDDQEIYFPVRAIPENMKLTTGYDLTKNQSFALKECLKVRGVTAIEGGYSTGKSTLIPLIAQTILNVDKAIKVEKIKESKDSIARKRSIKEMLEADSSDEEMYNCTQDSDKVL